MAALKEILGPEGEEIVSTSEPVRDKRQAAEFAAQARKRMNVVVDSKNANRATMVIGGSRRFAIAGCQE